MHQQDAGALHPAVRVRCADGAARVQQHVIVGRRRRFAEDDPAAARIDGPIGEQELRGQVQREAAQQAAIGGVELDRRGEPLTPELGPRPEKIRAVGVGRARGRKVVGELIIQRWHRVQLVERAPEQHAQVGAVVQHFRRVLPRDGLTERRVFERHDRGIEGERGHGQHEVRDQQAQAL